MSRISWSGGTTNPSFQYRSSFARFGGKPKSRRCDGGQHLCAYIHRICLQTRLEGFDYCIRHILEDRSAPFRQCSYVHPQSGKRCPNAARRTDRRDSTLCPWHIKKLYLKRKQAQIQQIRLHSEECGKKDDVKNLLKELEHFCTSGNHDASRSSVDWVQQEDGSITASDQLRKKIAEAAANLNFSESDDDCANALVDEVLRPDAMDSDSESIDSDHEDPLKHAGIYTAEEVSLVLRDKMLRLQSLYIEQFKHLQHLLREKRKKYQMSLAMEKEIPGMMSIEKSAVNDSSLQAQEDYQKIKALWRYHHSHGPEALVKMKAKEKRKAAIEGENYQPPSFPVCIFAKGDEVCSNKTLPHSNYCLKRKLNASFINKFCCH